MDAHAVPSLRWSLTLDDSVHLKLEALAVETLTEALAARRGVALEGAKGQQLVLRPGKAAAAEWAHKDDVLELAYGKQLAAAMCSRLGPWCGEYTWPELAGFRLEVVESKVTDEAGKVIKVVGWDDRPAEVQRPPADGAESTQPKPRRTRRRLLIAALAALLLAPLALFVAGHVHLRHVPYAIPDALRAPAPKTQLAVALGLGLRVRWLGISGYEISDGETIILTDPTFTRPTVNDVISGPLEIDPAASKSIQVADYILVNHAHYDHAADVPVIAKRTGAVVLGSRSVINLCRSRGVPPAQLMEVSAGQQLKLGTFDVIVRQGIHAEIVGIGDPMAGTIPEDAGPLWFWQYTNDGTFTYRLESKGTSLWFHPTSTLLANAKELWPPAKNLILGVTGEPFTREKLKTMLDTCRPLRVIPTHYDNFFHPRAAGLGLMPEADMDTFLSLVQELRPDLAVWLLDFEQTVHLPPD